MNFGNILNNRKDILSIDMLIFVIVNLLFSELFMLPWFLIIEIIGFGLRDDDKLFVNICIIIILLLVIIKMTGVTVLYIFQERFSKNQLIQKFIYNLKNNLKFKLIFLIFLLIPWVLWDFYIIFETIFQKGLHYTLLSDIIFIFGGSFIVSLMFGLFGNYVVLFIWWEIVKLFKKLMKKTV